MKFTDTLKSLEAKATDGPHVVDHANFELVAIDGDVYEYIANFSAGDFSASDLTDEEIAANAKLYCFLRNHAQEIINLVEAAEMAKLHVEELREGWRRGDIEADSGVRSNRNVYVETKLREALAALNKEPPKEIDPNKWAFDRKLESY